MTLPAGCKRIAAGAVFGFGVEAALHALRIVVSGAFDRFPRLRMVLGYLGEALPFWLLRIDFMRGHSMRTGRYPGQPMLARRPSEYLKEHFWDTTSWYGLATGHPVVRSVIGLDRELYAMDYLISSYPMRCASPTPFRCGRPVRRSSTENTTNASRSSRRE